MASRSFVSRCLLLVTFIVGIVTASPIARADASPPAGADSAAASNIEARRLFSQGQIHYSLGEYQEAIAAFRRAYELTSAPGLLFNIAQAYRLNGDCKRALETYRHFTRLVPTSEYRAEADGQIAALTVRCAVEASPTATRLEGVKPAQAVEPTSAAAVLTASAEVEPPRWSRRRKTAVSLLAGGVGLGLIAGGISWWNDGRYDDWRAEDQRLAAPSPGTPPSVWLADQQRNDALLRSIERTDTIDLVLAGTAIAAVLTSAVLLVISGR